MAADEQSIVGRLRLRWKLLRRGVALILYLRVRNQVLVNATAQDRTSGGLKHKCAGRSSSHGAYKL